MFSFPPYKCFNIMFSRHKVAAKRLKHDINDTQVRRHLNLSENTMWDHESGVAVTSSRKACDQLQWAASWPNLTKMCLVELWGHIPYSWCLKN